MRNQTKILVIFFAAILAVWGRAQADPASETAKVKPVETPAVHLNRREIVEKLQLTDAQKKQIRVARAAYRVSVAKLDNQIKLKKVLLENELDKPEPDSVQLDLLTGQLGELYGQRLNVKLKASIELEKKILTPQQADMLKALQVKESAASDEIL
jgi:Spy/CpxP family protein refolding chaperone